MNDAELNTVAEMRSMLETCLEVFESMNIGLMADEVRQTLETAKVFDLEDDL